MVRKINQLEQQWNEYLDKNNENSLFYKFIYSPDLTKVEEFVLIYITIINNSPVEIIKYDFSKKESFHVHYYYKKPPIKKIIDLKQNISPKETFEEIMNCADYIKKNWRKIKQEYLSNYQ